MKFSSQVQRLMPVDESPCTLDEYEAACGHTEAMDEGYRIARNHHTSYTNVVLVRNFIRMFYI